MRRLLTLLFLAAAALGGDPVHLVVLHTNDLHGQLEPLPPSPATRNRPAGGFAHLATMVRGARREAEERHAGFLLLDGGDIFQGTPLGNETRGDAVIEAMNALTYDAGALGNHEFDYGLKNLERLAGKADFPILAANLSGARNVKPYVLLGPPRVPCRVCVIGLITPGTPSITTRGTTDGCRFADPAPVVRGILKEVEADLFVVVSHLGRDDERRLAQEVDGLALILGGHSHTPYVEKIGGTLLVQTQGRGVALARADLDLDPDTWKVVAARGELLPVDPGATEPDLAIARIIERYGRDLDVKLKEVVGELAAPARRRRGLSSSSAGNWLADVTRRAGGAEIGFMNKGGIRCELEAGPVTRGDVYRIMPFENVVVSMDLTGAEVRALLERHLRPGAFPALEWSGLEVEVVQGGGDGEYELGAVRAGGRPLDPERTYRVAANSFLASGGDGFVVFRDGRNRKEDGRLFRDAIAADLAERSPVTPPAEERLKVVAAAKR